MNRHFRAFYRNNLLAAAAVAVVGTILFLTILQAYYHPFIPVILITGFLINLLTFRIAIGKAEAKINIMLAVTKSFAIKFFSYIALVVAMILIEKDKTMIIAMVLCIFLLYLTFTIIEVVALIKFASNK